MLTGIVVENYRVFEKEIEIELKPLTIFTGPNNSGKSSILNVLDIFKLIFEESSSLRELVKNGIPCKMLDEIYGGFDNLFSIDSGKEKMKLGFLWYSKQMKTEFKYVFELLKNGKIEKYTVLEKTTKEYNKIIEIEFHENKKDKDSYIQVNYTRINEIITNLEIRKNLFLDACEKMTIEINNKFGSICENVTVNNQFEYDKFLNYFKNKYKDILEKKGKIKFEFISESNEINSNNHNIYIINNYHKITKKEFNKFFSEINNQFNYNELADGPIINHDNPIISHLSKYNKCTNLLVDSHGNTFSIIENVNLQLSKLLDKIDTDNLNDIIKKELAVFQEEVLDKIANYYNEKYDIEIEIDFSNSIYNYYGLNNFEHNEGIFTFKLIDESNDLSYSDREISDIRLNQEENFQMNFDNWKSFLSGYQIIDLKINEKERSLLNGIIKKHYPSIFKINDYGGENLLGKIIFEIYSKVKFESDQYDFIVFSGLFSSLNEYSNFPFEDIVHLNISSIFNIPDFICRINAIEFINKIKSIENINNKKLFNDETLIFYADRLLNHNLINQCSKKEKIFLTEIFILFVSNKLSRDIYAEQDNSKLVRHFFRDLNAYANPKKVNSLIDYSGNRQKEISSFLEDNCLNFKWIKADFSKYFISHNSNNQTTRFSHFQQDNEISKLLNYYIHSEDEGNFLYKNSTLNGKENAITVLKEYLNEFDIADDVEIEILKKINAYNIYLIKKVKKHFYKIMDMVVFNYFQYYCFFQLAIEDLAINFIIITT